MRFLILLCLLSSHCLAALAIVASDTSPESIDEAVLLYVTGYHADDSTIQWDFGDGNPIRPEYGISMLHYYRQPGAYTVTVTETSHEPATYTDTETITVGGAWAQLPPRAAGPVLWLKFEDNLNDSSGNSNNGSVGAGTVAYAAAGAENKCLDLTAGGNAYVTIPDSSTLKTFTTGMTISYWAKQNVTHNADGYILQKASSYRSSIYESAPAYRFKGEIYGAVDGLAAPYLDETVSTTYPTTHSQGWHHYVVVYNNTGSDVDSVQTGKVTLYVDGLPCIITTDNTIRATTGAVVTNTNALTIGAASSSWEGYIDEVKIWNRPLTVAEIGVGFESWHAPFYNRSKQYIYYQIPGDITATATNTLTVVLTGTEVNDTLLNAHTPLTAEEVLLIDWSTYNTNNFTLTATLKNTGGTTLDSITEFFVKGYDGVSRISIDENDAIAVNGTKIFPVGTWISNPTGRHTQNDICNFDLGHPFSNQPWDLANWISVINTLNTRGQYGVGPINITGMVTRNLPLTSMDTYYDGIYAGLTNAYSNLGWCWDDEPDMVQATPNTYGAPTVASWLEYSHTKDAQVPVWNNLQGPTLALTPGGPSAPIWTNCYTYFWKYAPKRIGKKASLSDVSCVDYYAYDSRLDTRYMTSTAKFITVMDRFAESEPYTPRIPFIETWDVGIGIDPAVSTAAITQAELDHLSWLAIIHGVKGICWFPQHAGVVPPNGTGHAASGPEDEDIAAPTYAKITALKDVILSTAGGVTCTDDQNTWAADGSTQKVDTLVRVQGGYTWIIAVRVTEVGDSAGTATCTFTQSAATTGSAAVYGEGRSIVMTKGTWTDTFGLNAVHIYQLSDEAPVEQLPPVWNFIANKKLIVNAAITPYAVSATDVNVGDTLAYSAVGLPSGLVVNSSTGQVTGTPLNCGWYTTTWMVSDGTVTVTTTSRFEITTGTYYYPGFFAN